MGPRIFPSLPRTSLSPVALRLLIAALLPLPGCGGGPRLPVGALQTRGHVVDLDGARQVEVELSMTRGELILDGGAEKLLEASIATNVSEWMPELSYQVTDETGRLDLEQPPGGAGDGAKNTWELGFADGVPVRFDVNLGAGRGQLDLRGLDVTGLEVAIGAGELVIDLGGEWSRSFEASVDGGAGRTVLHLPDAVPVRVSVTRGIGTTKAEGLQKSGGDYVNEAYRTRGDGGVLLDISVRVGVGEVKLLCRPPAEARIRE